MNMRSVLWSTIILVPVSAAGILLLAWSVHVLPISFAYLGYALVWPWILLTDGELFNAGIRRIVAGGVAQWFWGFLFVDAVRRVRDLRKPT